ncbi:MAG: hypothetical protein BWY42_01610 [Candidatus Omnitrophica bacterium ADurb.Bin277]|nr:MAG: hypothetical protein BWY42_01610 [Candidatus Omnitrophica bacterium ADurb.Bin277]
MNSPAFVQHLAYFTGIGRYRFPLHIRMMDHLVYIPAQKLFRVFVTQHPETGRIGKSTIPFKINPVNRFGRRVEQKQDHVGTFTSFFLRQFTVGNITRTSLKSQHDTLRIL